MFEEALVESRGLAASTTTRWTTAGSIALQSAIAALLVVLPLLHPEAIPMLHDAPKLIAPPRTPPPIQIVPARPTASPAAGPGISIPVASSAPLIFLHGPLTHPGTEETPPAIGPYINMAGSTGPGVGLGLNPTGTGTNIAVVRAQPPSPTRVSSGVSQGLLLTPIRPVYPAIAKAAGIQGAVVMEAIISKAGRIESLHVLSGPPMLREAAKDAVQAARYQPYKLNGETVEVQTTIVVNFVLGS